MGGGNFSTCRLVDWSCNHWPGDFGVGGYKTLVLFIKQCNGHYGWYTIGDFLVFDSGVRRT